MAPSTIQSRSALNSARQAGPQPRLSLFRWSLLVFLWCEIWHLGYMYAWIPSMPVNLTAEPQRVAISLLSSGQFANPYKVPTGYTAHLPPLQPWLSSRVLSIFGTDAYGERVRQTINVTFCSLRAGLMPLLAVSLHLPLPAGILAGLALAWPSLRSEITTPFDDPISGLLIILLTISALRYGWRDGVPYRTAVIQGFLWGITLLFNASLVMILVALILAALSEYGRERLAGFAWRVAITVSVSTLVLVPWTVRNLEHFNEWFFIRDNAGLEFFLANSRLAGPSAIDNPAMSQHPNINADEATRVGRMGEIAYNKEKMTQANAWIRANPDRFLRLSLERLWLFWFPQGFGRRHIYPIWLFTLAGFGGLAVMLRSHTKAARHITSILLLYPVIYYFLQTNFRYRHPIYPFTMLCAGYLVYSLRSRVPKNVYALVQQDRPPCP